jgi:superfamily II DNA helicase RecQ
LTTVEPQGTPLSFQLSSQVNGCLERGIEAASWSSETPEGAKDRLARELLADLEDTSLRLLYTTPESLQMVRLR